MRVFLLAWPRGRSILGLSVSFFRLGLYFFCLSSNFLILGGVFDFRGLFLLTLALIFGPLGPLTLVTSLAGSLWNLGKKKCSLSSQRLLQGLRSKGRGRWKAARDCTDIRVIIGLSLLSLLRVCRNSYNVKGFNPCGIAIVPACLSQLLSQPGLCFLYAKSIGYLLLGLQCLLGQLSCLSDFLQLRPQIQRKLLRSGQLYLYLIKQLVLVLDLSLSIL